jgi:hypothetical protein
MDVTEVWMCSSRHHLFIIKMVSVSINGERHRIHTYLVQHCQIVIFLAYFQKMKVGLSNQQSVRLSVSQTNTF